MIFQSIYSYSLIRKALKQKNASHKLSWEEKLQQKQMLGFAEINVGLSHYSN